MTDCPLIYCSPAHSKQSRPDHCTGRTAGTGRSWSTPRSGETSHRYTACCTTTSTPCGRRGIGLRVRYAIECGPRCDTELTVVHLQEAVLAPGPLLLRDVEAVVDGDGVTVGHVLARVETQVRARVDLDLAAAALGEVPQLLINERASVGEAPGAGGLATAHAQKGFTYMATSVPFPLKPCWTVTQRSSRPAIRMRRPPDAGSAAMLPFFGTSGMG